MNPSEVDRIQRKLRNRYIARMKARLHPRFGPVGASGPDWLAWREWCLAGVEWAKGNATYQSSPPSTNVSVRS